MWVGGARWLPGSNSSPLSGTIQRPQIPSWDPMPLPPSYTHTDTHIQIQRKSENIPLLLKCLLLFLHIYSTSLCLAQWHMSQRQNLCACRYLGMPQMNQVDQNKPTKKATREVYVRLFKPASSDWRTKELPSRRPPKSQSFGGKVKRYNFEHQTLINWSSCQS